MHTDTDTTFRGWALITGASSGIGRAVALELASRGIGVYLVSEDRPGLERTAKEIRIRHETPARIIPEDLVQPGSANRVYEKVHETLRQDGVSRITVLANCAGIYVTTDREITDPGRVRQLLDLHVGVLTELCILIGRDMIENGGGFILNVSSVAALFPDPSSLSYGASKTYIRAFSRAIRLDWREFGIRVTCLMPSGVKTAFHERHNILLPQFARWGMITPERCAAAAIDALFHGRAEITPGLIAKIQRIFYPLLTASLFYPAGKRIYRRMLEQAGRAARHADGRQPLN